MKRILLPTDFSDNAFNAIKYAVQLFQNQKVDFFLLNTFTPMSYNAAYLTETPIINTLEDSFCMNSIKKLEEIEEKIIKEFANPKHTFVKKAKLNFLVSGITEAIEENQIDLVIMGTKGATGAKEILVGTQTMHTIKKVKCPVIAVPAEYKCQEPKNILFPTDFNVNKNNSHLHIIKELCSFYDSKLYMLNAYYGEPLNYEQEETRMFLDDFFENLVHSFPVADGMDAIEAIEDFEKEHVVDLLIMIHNKHSFFENLLFKPVINQIIYHTEIPFMVFPSEERMKSS